MLDMDEIWWVGGRGQRRGLGAERDRGGTKGVGQGLIPPRSQSSGAEGPGAQGADSVDLSVLNLSQP